MIRRPPSSTRTEPPVPYTRPFRSRSALLRQPRRLYRRERPQGESHQAAGDHGFGRRQPPLHHQRSGARDQSAFFARLQEDRLRLLFEQSRPRLPLISDERRVGKEWGSTCRSRWLQFHKITKQTIRLSFKYIST